MEELFNIKGKNVVITGASSGIGENLARMYAHYSANVALLARSKEKLTDLAEELKSKYKVEAFPIPCDVTSEEQIICAVEKAVSCFGQIHILVNDAGVTEKSEDFTTHTKEQWDKVINTNLTGVYLVSKEVAKNMKEHNYGKIINIASTAGYMGMFNQISYTASKAGVIGMTKSMAVEMGKYNITVNGIAPGYILTKMTNPNSSGYRYYKSRTILGYVGEPDYLRGTALLLSTDASRFITGTTIVVDGGSLSNS